MKPFFSIIMACCDVEPFIREALDSVMKQSFGDWECICGIEESKDKTEEILQEISGSEPRIRIFKHPRSGSCSATRNIGIDMAQGEYLIFLDGDDTLADGSLARIAEKIKARPGADIYPCVIVAYEEDSGKKEIRENFPPESSPEELTGPGAVMLLDRLWNGQYCPMLQTWVFRREFLIEHDLKCIYGLRRQDSEFTPRAIYFAERVVPLHEPFYLYRLRVNSVSSAAKGAGYFHKDWAIINKSLFAFHARISREPGFDRRVSECWARYWVSRFVYFWFEPKNMRNIPREQRLQTLNIVFADGFDDFNLLLKYAGISERVLGWWLRVFVRCPALRWLTESFFRCYYGLSGMRKKKKATSVGYSSRNNGGS
jgi:glycosyltransferase involved in cell wall biosynthesis